MATKGYIKCKMECEKEVIPNYSVTGNLKNIYLHLFKINFYCKRFSCVFFIGLLHFLVIFSQVTWLSAHNVKHSEQNWKNVIQKQSLADVLQNRCSKTFTNFRKHLQARPTQHPPLPQLTHTSLSRLCWEILHYF